MTEKQIQKALSAKFGRTTVTSGGNGTEVLIDCPFCDHHKLSVNTTKGVWQCWHCQETGTLSRLLGRQIVVEPSQRKKPVKTNVGYNSPGVLIPLDELPEEHEAILYVKNRKFNPKLLSETFGISYCSKGNSYGGGVFNTTGTLIIPIYEAGKLIAWQSRLLYNPDSVKPGEESAYGWVFDTECQKYKTPPKYFTSPGYKKGEHLFNYDNASKFGFVVVTEGAFDAMRVGKCAIATFGKGISDTQVQMLRDTWKVVILLLDPDAKEDQLKIRKKIEGAGLFGSGNTSGVKCVSVDLKNYKDAGEAPACEVARQIISASLEAGVDLRQYTKVNPFGEC